MLARCCLVLVSSIFLYGAFSAGDAVSTRLILFRRIGGQVIHLLIYIILLILMVSPYSYLSLLLPMHLLERNDTKHQGWRHCLARLEFCKRRNWIIGLIGLLSIHYGKIRNIGEADGQHQQR